MLEYMITQIVALLALTAICTLLIVFGYREFKYRRKIDFLTHLVDKGYETENVDINNL